jgi:hypothetical protein
MKSETRTALLPSPDCCLAFRFLSAFIRVHPRLILPASQTDSLVFPVSQSLLHKRHLASAAPEGIFRSSCGSGSCTVQSPALKLIESYCEHDDCADHDLLGE